jgi:hypothetical protein
MYLVNEMKETSELTHLKVFTTRRLAMSYCKDKIDNIHKRYPFLPLDKLENGYAIRPSFSNYYMYRFTVVKAEEVEQSGEFTPPPWPYWATGLADPQQNYMQIGAQLATRDGRRCTNAVVADVDEFKSPYLLIKIITDVGNIFDLTLDEVEDRYYPPAYIMDLAKSRPCCEGCRYEYKDFYKGKR